MRSEGYGPLPVLVGEGPLSITSSGYEPINFLRHGQATALSPTPGS